MYCASCGIALAPGPSFCSRCGARSPLAQIADEGLNPVAALAKTNIIHNLIVATSVVSLGGLVVLLLLTVAMIKTHVDPALVIGSLFFFLCLIGFVSSKLIRLLSNTIDLVAHASLPVVDRPNRLAQPTQDLHLFEPALEPVASVTEHTTRTLQSVRTRE